VNAALGKMPSVKGLEFREPQEEGTVDVVAEAASKDGEDEAAAKAGKDEVSKDTASKGADIRRDISRALAAANIPILMMRPLDLSLEEIFLQVTTEEKAVEAEPDDGVSQDDTQQNGVQEASQNESGVQDGQEEAEK
jgi:ABC-2 type transport system ATP-binding protein